MKGRDAQQPDEEQGLLEQEHKPAAAPKLFGLPVVIVAGLSYCVASGSMVLLNKAALSGFSFKAPLSLLLFQCTLAVMLVKMCEMLGYVKLQPLKWELVRVWLPVNFIFVGMLGSSFYALAALGVGMVTVWKNVSNFITASCDVVIFKKSYSIEIWGSLVLMLVSAVTGAATDSNFSWHGYSWQIANCVFTSAYALYLRHAMDKVVDYTSNKQKMDEFSMVFYNNLLSIPPVLVLMAVQGEFTTLPQQAALSDPAFYVVALMGGLIGFGISFSALWFLSLTTATYYSLVGALNKIPIAMIGVLFLGEGREFWNLLSIVIGVSAGVLFVVAKTRGK